MNLEEGVKKAVKEQVNPKLNQHSGSVTVTAIEDGIVFIQMLGECGGCPSQQFTVEDVVKPLIQEACPDVKDVVIDNTPDEEFMKIAKEILGEDIFDK